MPTVGTSLEAKRGFVVCPGLDVGEEWGVAAYVEFSLLGGGGDDVLDRSDGHTAL